MILPRLRAPIVLVHGLFGFDRVCIGNWVLVDYFPGIPRALEKAGNRVLVARLSPTRGVADRAAQLKEFLDRHAPGEAVHLFGHSMGGLDARYMISHLGMAARVLSLTTLGTPHRGSPFADWALERIGRLVGPVLDFFSLPRQAFRDLTVAACAEFNARTPAMPGVRYFSVAGRFEPHWPDAAWQLSASVVGRAEGPNDGIVSVASASYGECTLWEGNHMSLVNWPAFPGARVCDRLPDYAILLRRLADEGF
jgi:triacylglycerol lipase